MCVDEELAVLLLLVGSPMPSGAPTAEMTSGRDSEPLWVVVDRFDDVVVSGGVWTAG